MKPAGWRYESYKHSLAAKGVRTKYDYYARTGFGQFFENAQTRGRAQELKQARLAGSVQAQQLRAREEALNRRELTPEEEQRVQDELARLREPLRSDVGEARQRRINAALEIKKNAERRSAVLDAEIAENEENINNAHDELRRIPMSRGTPQEKHRRSIAQQEIIEALESRQKDLKVQRATFKKSYSLAEKELKKAGVINE